MKKLTLLLVALLIGLTYPLTSVGQDASSDAIDMDRMNRDIRISEGILTELFESVVDMDLIEARYSIGRIASPSVFEKNRIEGIYLPGYGIVFIIPDLNTGILNGSLIFSGQSNSATGGQADKTLEERRVALGNTVQNMMKDYFVDYASSITQLQSNDRILLIYGKSLEDYDTPILIRYNQNRVQNGPISSSEHLRPEATVISSFVVKSDLEEFKKGNLNPTQFEDRIETVISEHNVITVRNPVTNPRDLNLFASIMKTALDDENDSDISMGQEPTWFYLDNFGALYQGELGFRTVFSIGFGYSEPITLYDYQQTVISDTVRSTFRLIPAQDSTLRVIGYGAMARSDSAMVRQQLLQRQSSLDSTRAQLIREQEQVANLFRANIENERARTDSARHARELEVQEKIDDRLELIKDLIVDYGQTLTSIESDQSLLLVLNVSGSSSDSETIHIHANKSDLEAVGRGEITRQQALDRISVTRQE